MQICTEVTGGIQTNRRKEIYLILHPETGHGKAPSNQYTGSKREADTVSFSQDTANKTGKAERTIRRQAKIGKELKSVAGKLELKKHLAIEAKERQRGGQGGVLLTVKLQEASKGEAAEIAAKEIGKEL